MIDGTEPPWLEHEGVTHILRPVDPKKNARRARSPVCNDQPHESRVPFDPPGVLLDKTLGRKKDTR
jgi:hypothetical protein